VNTATNLLGNSNTVSTTGGYGNVARNRFGDNNIVTTQGGYADLASNLLGTGNTVTSRGGFFNGARSIGGNSNTLTVGGPGSNLNLVLNVGGDINTINAGGPGNLNAGFNFFGTNNAVSAGPGPLALAGSVLQDGQNVTKTNPGIAINNFRVGGAALTSGQTSTVPKAPAGPVSKISVGGRNTANAAGATTGSNKK
jgi:hypothetical protein